MADKQTKPNTKGQTARYMEAKRELWFWKYSRRDNWSSLFFTLLNKSDFEHRTKLEQAFPRMVKVFRDWQESVSEDEFFADVVPSKKNR